MNSIVNLIICQTISYTIFSDKIIKNNPLVDLILITLFYNR